jgi:structural maintenance of chromosome 2
LLQKSEEHKRLEIQFEEMKRDNHEKNKEVRETEELLFTLSIGVSAQGGHKNGYMEQLQGIITFLPLPILTIMMLKYYNFMIYIEARKNAFHALTEIEQAKVKISHLKKELNVKEPLAIKAANDNQDLLNDYELAKKTAQDLMV